MIVAPQPNIPSSGWGEITSVLFLSLIINTKVWLADYHFLLLR
jgi:hypothetical protein